MRLDAAEVRLKARGEWGWLLARLAPSLAHAIGARRPGHVGCPVHGGVDGFRLFGDFEETGGGVCNTCGKFHDGFALLGWVNGWPFRECLEAVACELGFEVSSRSPSAPRPPPKERAHDTTRHENAKRRTRAQLIRERISKVARKPGFSEGKI